jgi:adenine C2-methylase RlmN of 23S rRNA A2503 and tRNA A37
MACGQCHLTATQQTQMKPATAKDYGAQFRAVLNELATHPNRNAFVPALKRMNIEFMARGEPLANPNIVKRWPEVHDAMAGSAVAAVADAPFAWFPSNPTNGSSLKYHISTIMPDSFRDQSLVDSFVTGNRVPLWAVPTLYYSAWSIRSQFKERWMPRTMPTKLALAKLSAYQSAIATLTGNAAFAASKVIVHGAFVNGENDSTEEVLELLNTMKAVGLTARFNVIRYNPPSVGPFAPYAESTEERRVRLVQLITAHNPGGVKCIDRVGRDVFASCGTFIPPSDVNVPLSTTTVAPATGALASASH